MEFNINFAQQMSDASAQILSAASIENEADRASLYTALVACEIALKAALEYANKPLEDIPRTHNLSKLLDLLSTCTVLCDVTNGKLSRVPASRIRGIVVTYDGKSETVGNLLQAEKYGASIFPNEIRYGSILKYFPPGAIHKLSVKLISWVKLHADDLQA